MSSADKMYTPSAGMILPHYYAGGLFFLAGAFLLLLSAGDLLGHYFQPHLLAVTHILVLGWGTMIIFGALYQILPVILEVKLYSEKLSRISMYTLIPGVILLGWSFWKFRTGFTIQLAAGLILISVTAFVWNIFKTIRSAGSYKTDVEFILTSAVWLWITVGAGTVLALNLSFAFLSEDHLEYLPMHAHMGLVGWFLLLIMGVASRLVPMFLISKGGNGRFLDLAYYSVNIGLIVFCLEALIFNDHYIQLSGALMIACGLASFILFLSGVYRERVKKNLDAPLKQSFSAFVIMLLPLILAIVILSFGMAGPKFLMAVTIVYGMSIIIGFISGLILGKTYKTLPFMLILQMSREHKRQGLFTMKQQDLYSVPMVRIQFIAHAMSVLFLSAGVLCAREIVITGGAVMLLLSALLYNISLLRMLLSYIKK